jgi:hypothetical protein
LKKLLKIIIGEIIREIAGEISRPISGKETWRNKFEFKKRYKENNLNLE